MRSHFAWLVEGDSKIGWTLNSEIASHALNTEPLIGRLFLMKNISWGSPLKPCSSFNAQVEKRTRSMNFRNA